MTLNEAYLFLARRQTAFEDNSDLYKKEVIESGNIAIECIVKRIPRMPNVHNGPYGAMYLCPVCGRALSIRDGNYCSRCGQAIDWYK